MGKNLSYETGQVLLTGAQAVLLKDFPKRDMIRMGFKTLPEIGKNDKTRPFQCYYLGGLDAIGNHDNLLSTIFTFSLYSP